MTQATWLSEVDTVTPGDSDLIYTFPVDYRGLKTALKNQFPNLGNVALVPTIAQINSIFDSSGLLRIDPQNINPAGARNGQYLGFDGTRWGPVSAAGTAGAPDPSVSVLLHFDGTAGSTAVVDSSGSHKIFSPSGDGMLGLRTDKKKFGTASLTAVGSLSAYAYVSTPQSNDFAFPGDFTIEFWVSHTMPLDSRGHIFIGTDNVNSIGSGGWSLKFTDSGLVFMTATPNNFFSGVALPSSKNDGNFHHYAICRSGTDLRGFYDGVQFATVFLGGTVSADYPLYVGSVNTNAYFQGYIDEVQIVKGRAKYTSNFTPPTAPFDGLIAPQNTETYQLPLASDSVRGGVQVGGGLWMDGEALSVATGSGLDINAASGNVDINWSALPAATATVRGAVKIGPGLSADANGLLSLALPIADATTLGAVRIGPGITRASDGTISVAPSSSYVLPTASGTVKGGVKVGAAAQGDRYEGFFVTNDTLHLALGAGVTLGTDNNLTLAPATTSAIGGVIVGAAGGFTLQTNGTLGVNWAAMPLASNTVVGGAKIGGVNATPIAGLRMYPSGGAGVALGRGLTFSGESVVIDQGVSLSYDPQDGGKLIVNWANMPMALQNVRGGIRVGAGLFMNESDGKLSVQAGTGLALDQGGYLNVVWSDNPNNTGGGSSYTLPAATTSTRGGIRVGGGLWIGSGDILGVTTGSGLEIAGGGGAVQVVWGAMPTATDTVKGGVKVGGNDFGVASNGLAINNAGTLFVARGNGLKLDSTQSLAVDWAQMAIPTATATVVGGVTLSDTFGPNLTALTPGLILPGAGFVKRTVGVNSFWDVSATGAITVNTGGALDLASTVDLLGKTVRVDTKTAGDSTTAPASTQFVANATQAVSNTATNYTDSRMATVAAQYLLRTSPQAGQNISGVFDGSTAGTQLLLPTVPSNIEPDSLRVVNVAYVTNYTAGLGGAINLKANKADESGYTGTHNFCVATGTQTCVVRVPTVVANDTNAANTTMVYATINLVPVYLNAAGTTTVEPGKAYIIRSPGVILNVPPGWTNFYQAWSVINIYSDAAGAAATFVIKWNGELVAGVTTTDQGISGKGLVTKRIFMKRDNVLGWTYR